MGHAVNTHTHTRLKTKVTIVCPVLSVTLRDAIAHTSCLYVYIKFLFETKDLCPPCITTNGKERLSRTTCTWKVCTDDITAWIEVVATESSEKRGLEGGGLLELARKISNFRRGENEIFVLLGFCAA
jgi:hypothetical protein